MIPGIVAGQRTVIADYGMIGAAAGLATVTGIGGAIAGATGSSAGAATVSGIGAAGPESAILLEDASTLLLEDGSMILTEG